MASLPSANAINSSGLAVTICAWAEGTTSTNATTTIQIITIRNLIYALSSFVRFYFCPYQTHHIIAVLDACHIQFRCRSVHRQHGHAFQSAQLLHQGLMLGKVHHPVQLHIVYAPLKHTMLTDELLAPDMVTDASQIDESVE